MSDIKPPARWAMDVSDLTKFDPVIAHLAAWASYYAYYDQANDIFADLAGAIHIAKIPSNTNTGQPLGWLFQVGEANVFVWAGTTSAVQLYGIWRDALYGRVPNQPLGVQALYGVVRWVVDILAGNANLMKQMMTAKKTVFCGHSIGGALAMTLLAALKGDGSFSPQPFCYYTFGSPKTGNGAFRNALPEGFNVVTPGDPVPKLPPFGHFRLGDQTATLPSYTVSPAVPFYTAGTTVYLRPGSEAEIVEKGTFLGSNDAPIEWDAVRFGSRLFFQTELGGQPRKVVEAWNDSIEAHEMNLYLSRLEKLLPVSSGQHATMGDDGKKAENELKGDIVMIQQENQKPMLTITNPPDFPAPIASQGVVPLSARRRH